MTGKELIMMILFSLYFSVLLILTLFIITRYILVPYKHLSKTDSIRDLLTLLDYYIQKEIEIYEENIFNQTEFIDNSHVDNFYNDIVKRTIDSLPNSFIKKMQYYMTEEYIVSIISRTTMNYIKSKIKDVEKPEDPNAIWNIKEEDKIKIK